MIELDAIGKRFGANPSRAVHAIRDVSLRVEPGVVLGVAGPNGAGKTTLLGLMLGFLTPTSGAVRIAGLPPRQYLRREGAGYLPERMALPPEWRVRETLVAFAEMERPAGGARAHVEAALERFGLAEHAGRELGTLSRGLLQRVGLAQALLSVHPLVVLDEPTEGLDPLGRIQFREEIAALRSANSTVILASQDLAELERVADRAIVLSQGEIRESVELRRMPEAGEWTLRLAASHESVGEIFPGAGPHGQPSMAGGPAEYLVSAADAADLSLRLAALVAAGGVLLEVRPRAASLEARVERAVRPVVGDEPPT